MPNHVTNFVKAPVHILLALLNNKGYPDFNQVIPTTLPYPETPSSTNSYAVKQAFNELKTLTEEQRKLKFKEMVKNQPPYWDIVNGVTVYTPWEELYEQAYQNMLVTGFPDWYDWNCDHWMTKLTTTQIKL